MDALISVLLLSWILLGSFIIIFDIVWLDSYRNYQFKFNEELHLNLVGKIVVFIIAIPMLAIFYMGYVIFKILHFIMTWHPLSKEGKR